MTQTLTTREACDYLEQRYPGVRVSASTMRRWGASVMPATIDERGRYHFTAAAIDERMKLSAP